MAASGRSLAEEGRAPEWQLGDRPGSQHERLEASVVELVPNLERRRFGMQVNLDHPHEFGGWFEAAHEPDAVGRPVHGDAVDVRPGDAVRVLGRKPQAMAAKQLVPTVGRLPADVGCLGKEVVRRAGDAEPDDPRTRVGEDVEPQRTTRDPERPVAVVVRARLHRDIRRRERHGRIAGAGDGVVRGD